jgi:HAD superfamily hydrolase (TIGR01509 family)
MIKLFVFDLGNVILPFEHRQIAVKLYERARGKTSSSPEEVFRFMFDIGKGLIDIYEEGLMSSLQFFSSLRDRYRIDMEYEEFVNIWNPIFRENPEVNEIILSLKEKGYPIFLLSNTNELHFSYIIEKYPIVHAMDEWILSFEVGVKKPGKRIFDAIFEKTDVRHDEVFYIDDIQEYVDAAKGFGMDGIVFRDAAQLRQALKEKGI